MIALAYILLFLLYLNFLMTVLYPLLELHIIRKDHIVRWRRLRIVQAYVGMFCGSLVCTWLFDNVNGPRLILTWPAAITLSIAGWIATLGGIAAVIYGVVKVRRM